jgi:hypothetical protein
MLGQIQKMYRMLKRLRILRQRQATTIYKLICPKGKLKWAMHQEGIRS